jgi:site-specific DNA-cytosine methylase
MIASTLFSGGGLADIGFRSAGYDIGFGIEYHPPAAEIYKLNFGHDSLKDLLEADPADYDRPDYLHLSSPCQSFSGGNVNGEEKDSDKALAQKCCDFVEYHRPARLSIENVPAYRGSESFKKLISEVSKIYEHVSIDTIDLATLGVPQNRWRLIVRASQEPHQPMYQVQTHSNKPDFFRKPFNNWWDCINDLIPDFQVSELTEKQKAAIEYFKPTRPFLIQRFGDRGGRNLTIRIADKPCWTILASRGGDVRSGNRTKVIDCVTEDGVCRSLNIRSIARLMSVPDSYQFPPDAIWHECWRVLGNGVPPMAMQRIAKSFDYQLQQPTGIKLDLPKTENEPPSFSTCI